MLTRTSTLLASSTESFVKKEYFGQLTFVVEEDILCQIREQICCLVQKMNLKLGAYIYL